MDLKDAIRIEFERAFREALHQMHLSLRVVLDPLEDWVRDLIRRPLANDWREQLAAHLATWDAEGFHLADESVPVLERWIEAWANYLTPMHERNAAINIGGDYQEVVLARKAASNSTSLHTGHESIQLFRQKLKRSEGLAKSDLGEHIAPEFQQTDHWGAVRSTFSPRCGRPQIVKAAITWEKASSLAPKPVHAGSTSDPHLPANHDSPPGASLRQHLPASHRGTWLSGKVGEGYFEFNNAIENQQSGLIGKKVRFQQGYIAIGGFPPESYYGGSAQAASVEIDAVSGTSLDSRRADAKMAQKLRKQWRRPANFRWNHAGPPGSKVMELVSRDVHDAVAHKGPAAPIRRDSRIARQGRATTRVIAVVGVYLTLRDALQSAGIVNPSYSIHEWEDYHYVADDNSIFIVEWGWFSSARIRFVAGPRRGQQEAIANSKVDEYRRIAERKWGRYIPGGLFSEPRFIPGTERKSLPLIKYKNGIPWEVGWIDEKGVHRYQISFPEII